jgi:multidrug transporter EmrE-like cation transporter
VTLALYVISATVFSTCGVLLLRSSVSGLDELTAANVRALALEPRFVGGFGLYALSFLVFLLALRSHEVVQIFPIFVGAGYCGVVLGAYLFLDEPLTGTRLAGIAVIFAGIVILSR